ncbi:MAG: PilZ domain-containing protein [Bdellovibrionota bacterium]
MIENRKFYRLPSHSRFVLGNENRVYAGKAVNISFGGAFVHLLDVTGIKSGDRMKCDFMLSESGPVLSSMTQVKRVAVGSSNPSDYSGVGVEFVDFTGDSRRIVDEFIFEQKRLYELLGTLLMNTEPDLRSMKPMLSKLPLQRQPDLRDLRVFVESTLRSIQLVENKGV